MQIKINDTEVVDVPTDISEITLGKFIQYWDAYGHDLDKRLKDILAAKYDDEFDRTIDLMGVEYDEAISWYSFFSGYDFSTIKGIESDELLKYYRVIRQLLLVSEEQTYVLNQKIYFQNEIWTIRDWKVVPGAFIFNELLISKEVTRQIHSIGKGKWEALPYLCAVFLRKEGEAFNESFVSADAERLKIMHELPMSAALQVAFFLTISVRIYQQTFLSSKLAEAEI